MKNLFIITLSQVFCSVLLIFIGDVGVGGVGIANN